MATPTIPNGEEYFFPIIYEGNGAGQRVGKFVPFTDSGTIDNSCLFENNVSSYLSRTLSSNGSGTTVTFSCWVKRDILAQGLIGSVIMMHSNISSNSEILSFDSSDRLHYYEVTSGSRKWEYISNRTFEDTSKWYHILVSRDTTNATQADRVKIYVDGERITSWNTETQSALNATGYWNQTTYDAVVGNTNSGSYIDGAGYLAEVNMVDGTALGPDTFGVTDTSTGRWIPKTLSGITYGTNGFRLKFQDSSALGDDTSGNGNDFTATNLASTDQTTDSPTQNFATLAVNGPNISSTFSEGNLKVTLPTSSAMTGGLSTLKMVSGKYYMEATIDSVSSAGVMLGIMGSDRYASTSDYAGSKSDSYGYYSVNGNITNNTASVSFGDTYTTSDIIGIAVDLDNDKLYFSKNGTFQNSANPSAGTGGQSIISAKSTTAGFYRFSLTDAGTGSTDIVTANFGQKSFTYTPPTGFVALQQDNLPETAKGVSGLVWTKNRDSTDSHQFYDSSRGRQLVIASNTTSAESTVTDGLQKFLAGGQQIEDDVSINTSGESYVSWNWIANSGTTASNTDGSITSTVQANTTAGFSIVQYTGTGSAGTIGHGLSSAPEFIILKRLVGVQDWLVGNTASGWTNHLFLNGADALATTSITWNNTAPTSSVFSVGTGNSSNKSGDPFIGYVWHGVDGFSKIGSYTGNGNADGPFVYTGFKPAWVMYKQTNTTNYWAIFDSKRSPHNVMQNRLAANYTNVEDVSTANQQDFLSNGFKLRGTDTATNQSGGTYIYMAFAEHPFVGDGTSPVTAR